MNHNLVKMTAEELLLLAVMQPALRNAIDKELDRRAIHGTDSDKAAA